MSTRLDDLNARSEGAAREFLGCCASTRWSRMMAAARPFASREAMAEQADAIWRSLDRADWLEAFAAHPQIGQSGEARAAPNSAWSEHEQSGVRWAGAAVRDRLAQANRDYQARFGYIFIVCATGKSADEMLALVERRLTNQPDDELQIAAEEQRNITRLRLAKLLI